MKKQLFCYFFIITIIFSFLYPIRSFADTSAITKVSIFEFLSSDPFTVGVHKALEDIEKNNPDKVKFTFYDGANSQDVQNQQINTLLNEDNTDIILVNMVDPSAVSSLISKFKIHNIPVIFYSREPTTLSDIASYRKAYYIGTDAKESGILQGNILIDKWKKSKQTIDTDNNDILEYIMFVGDPLNQESIYRTKYSTSTIESAGIQISPIATIICKWQRNCAKDSMKAKLLQYGDRIEAVIANNDAMALGAIDALQSLGYNNPDSAKIIPVVGVDAIPEAREMIAKGLMTGTVVQNPNALANAIYSVGLNIANSRPPLQDTNYTFDSSGVAIRIPYEGTVTSN